MGKVVKRMETKKKITLPIKVIIIGCIIGLVVAGIGGIKQIAANKTNEDRRQAALKASEEAVAKANARLKEIETEYNTLKSQYDAKADECDAINNDMRAADWYTKSTKCQREKSEINSKMTDLEMEDSAITRGLQLPLDHRVPLLRVGRREPDLGCHASSLHHAT